MGQINAKPAQPSAFVLTATWPVGADIAILMDGDLHEVVVDVATR
jgi:hypothetical protein